MDEIFKQEFLINAMSGCSKTQLIRTYKEELDCTEEEIEELLRECGRLDQQAKGMLRGDPWVSLDRILLRVAGIRSPSLDGEAPYLSLV